jgi:hypothetical protein
MLRHSISRFIFVVAPVAAGLLLPKWFTGSEADCGNCELDRQKLYEAGL